MDELKYGPKLRYFSNVIFFFWSDDWEKVIIQKDAQKINLSNKLLTTVVAGFLDFIWIFKNDGPYLSTSLKKRFKKSNLKFEPFFYSIEKVKKKLSHDNIVYINRKPEVYSF